MKETFYFLPTAFPGRLGPWLWSARECYRTIDGKTKFISAPLWAGRYSGWASALTVTPTSDLPQQPTCWVIH